jgi:hypothetical protein
MIRFFILIFLCIRVDALTVVVTSKHLYSVIIPLFKNIASPEVLYPEHSCCHGYSLKPSDIMTLKNADLVIWQGKNQEAFLEASITKEKSVVIFDSPFYEWLVPEKVLSEINRILPQIETKLTQEEKSIFLKNVEVFKERLKQLQKKLVSKPFKNIIFSSRVFSPLAAYTEVPIIEFGQTISDRSNFLEKAPKGSSVWVDASHFSESDVDFLTKRGMNVVPIDAEAKKRPLSDIMYERFMEDMFKN